jgi:hypothetical protein
MEMPGLRFAVLRLGDADWIRLVRSLRDVRQSGCAAHFERAWHGHAFLGLSIIPRSGISLRALPESLFLLSNLPPHRAHKAACGAEARIRLRFAIRMYFNRNIRKPAIDFLYFKRMITEGDGVRLITAVLFAGQMMTPDKFLVAESCPGKEPTNFIDFFRSAFAISSFLNICVMT